MGFRVNGFDFGGIVEDIARAARDFGDKMKDMGPEFSPYFDCRGHGRGGRGPFEGCGPKPDLYFYPPTNSYSAPDGSLVFEFALAGIDESAVSVTFQGDYLVLSAKAAAREGEDPRFSWRGFRPRDIDRQKYRAPAEDYVQEKAKAVFRNGVLTVTVPPKHPEGEGIRVEIVKEGS